WGYSSHTTGVSLETQAAFAVRHQFSNLLNGVPLSIWYDWKNDGPDPNENEHNFGLVLPDLKPKPAYVALQTFSRELSGHRLARRLALPDTNDYALVFTNSAGNQKLAAWTSAEGHSVKLQTTLKKGSELRATTGFGEKFHVQIHSGNLEIQLTPMPEYID